VTIIKDDNILRKMVLIDMILDLINGKSSPVYFRWPGNRM